MTIRDIDEALLNDDDFSTVDLTKEMEHLLEEEKEEKKNDKD